MRVAIIGGGAIGLLFSYYLKQEHNVILYVRSHSQKMEIEANGITVRNQEGLFHTYVQVELISEWEENVADLVIVCVKQYQLESLLKDMKLTHGKPSLFIQNGMAHLKIIDRFRLTPVYVGSVEHGAYRENGHAVVHTGIGETKIACYQGHNQKIVNELVHTSHPSFRFRFVDDYKDMLQKKLVVNALINPLTALLNVENGMLMNNPHYYQTFTDVFTEVSNILGLDDGQLYFEHARQICLNTAHNHSSMLKDLEAGRETEIETILGYLIAEARQRKMEAPLITALFHLIKGRQLERGGK
ncbi:2-dehydropantoate 2-reductase [Robertmurraya sp. DFI.2.37]|uniref:2-dehydropantoate 2-reductase n=1 Tax=Robertmurraya sp. DFI.2.37 TaxID=3031819 RepID=UPI0012462FEF|nr:2-dehydropantoate 2-reductase [Robertmurraya sp. DFI.2.37]MDF1506691.1 2-dehydropantoate 2-reductase [Robertmurraya sp. DFI.2.37]